MDTIFSQTPYRMFQITSLIVAVASTVIVSLSLGVFTTTFIRLEVSEAVDSSAILDDAC